MRPHIRQAVTITGLALPTFQRAVENMEKIHLAFSNAFPPDVVEPWQPAYFRDFFAIDAHSRYFTKTYLVPDQDRFPFDQPTDPEGILTSMEDGELIHTADNHVDYLGPIMIAGKKK
jgi:hypothetical protein